MGILALDRVGACLIGQGQRRGRAREFILHERYGGSLKRINRRPRLTLCLSLHIPTVWTVSALKLNTDCCRQTACIVWWGCCYCQEEEGQGWCLLSHSQPRHVGYMQYPFTRTFVVILSKSCPRPDRFPCWLPPDLGATDTSYHSPDTD